ncbi:MarR family winged helix-turn-helix transcriptional regulator [Allobranchiibius sp. GilTou73]|uniref:MarR family winged helix-turn-helix transcriptional regulator n=1 Tax=Allobranchiibius sp. GilTou73 TaxID=2904523 RepID=UPI001F48B9DD|nr:MarR family transcriptional regulator [Allobranchiibius sp. GilTou73]UIJ34515.1 MarR family transcriptional regulator [Allobranchiibius sp. GilTou73]
MGTSLPERATGHPAEVDEVVTAVLTASRVLVGVSARSLEAVEETVTLTQFRTLVVLHAQGEINLARLAHLLEVTSSTALRMIDRLLTSQLVTRRENAADRREVLLGLTDAGERLVQRVTTRRRRAIAAIVRDMDVQGRDDLVVALRAFADAAREPHIDQDAAALGW